MATGALQDERRSAPGGWALGTSTSAPRRSLDAMVAAGRPSAIILFALSRLDLLNAAHGRDAGDAVVLVALQRLTALAAIHGGDLARLGGWRFALTIAADEGAALTVAGAGTEALARPFAGGAVVGSRAAVAVRGDGEDGAAVLARAADALAAAHAAEAGAPVLAEARRAATLDGLAIDLHHAIARGEIDILFQPQVRLIDDVITGVEALARWAHPQLGALGADELFAAAARADLGLALSEHIQEAALRQAAAWPASLRTLRLSLNLTAGDVARPGFAAALLDRVAASGFPADRLTLELTETGPVLDLTSAAATLERLRAVGCRVAMDDFGAGYSSLAYLKILPLDIVKLDKSLIEGMQPGSRDARLVEAAVGMARALGLAVIAEGVEHEAQRDLLAAAGCDSYQGYLCAPALDGDALIALMRA